MLRLALLHSLSLVADTIARPHAARFPKRKYISSEPLAVRPGKLVCDKGRASESMLVQVEAVRCRTWRGVPMA